MAKFLKVANLKNGLATLGSDPRLLRLTMARSFDGTLGSDPEHQDRPRRWLGASILHKLLPWFETYALDVEPYSTGPPSGARAGS
jgi:hypothetical protein